MIEEENDKKDSFNEQEEKKKSNIFINIIIFIVIFLISIIMYAKYIGTKGIITKEYKIESQLIPKNFSGIKVVFMSDILLGSTIDLNDIDELVVKINELKPDIILFGGGLTLDKYELDSETTEELIKKFNSLNVKLGKYAVKGYSDGELFDNIMTSSNFKVMNNSYEFIYNENNIPICINAIGSYNKGDYNLETSFEFFNIMPDCFTITFTHESDIIDNIMNLEHKPNLIFAGNTLGGEIKLPFYGSVNKMEGSMKYFLDYYKKDNTLIYISSGLGTKELDMRLFNRPSFNFFRLKSLNEN